jgi:hypothetical protein
LIISEAGVAVKYNVYLRKDHILLQFVSTNRSRVELAAILLRHGGRHCRGGKGGRQRRVARQSRHRHACGWTKELRDAVEKFVETALEKGWVDEKRAKRWLEKLEGGVAAWEGKKFKMRLVKGALVVSFSSTSRESLEEVVREFKAMGLVEGVHFTVKWGGGRGRVYLFWPRG